MIIGTKGGDKISGTLIAEDVGKVAPPNYEVMTAVYDVPKEKAITLGAISILRNQQTVGRLVIIVWK